MSDVKVLKIEKVIEKTTNKELIKSISTKVNQLKENKIIYKDDKQFNA